MLTHSEIDRHSAPTSCFSFKALSKLLNITVPALQTPVCNLGGIYTELKLFKAEAGQFFTPYPVSRAMAVMMGDLRIL